MFAETETGRGGATTPFVRTGGVCTLEVEVGGVMAVAGRLEEGIEAVLPLGPTVVHAPPTPGTKLVDT